MRNFDYGDPDEIARDPNTGEIVGGPFAWGYQNLRENVIDRAAVEVFTQGQCHALALAIHEATGWPMVVVGYGDERESRDDWQHVMCRMPDGRLIDAEGPQEEDATVKGYTWFDQIDCGDVAGLTETFGEDHAVLPYCYPWQVATARLFVPAVLATVG